MEAHYTQVAHFGLAGRQMILVVLTVLLFMAITGVVEGIKNLQVPETKWTDQNAYHLWRTSQGAAVLLFGAASAYVGLSWTWALVTAFSWIAGNGLYSRVLIRVAWNQWNYNWLPDPLPWWSVFDPSPLIDWACLIYFTVGAALFPFIGGLMFLPVWLIFAIAFAAFAVAVTVTLIFGTAWKTAVKNEATKLHADEQKAKAAIEVPFIEAFDKAKGLLQDIESIPSRVRKLEEKVEKRVDVDLATVEKDLKALWNRSAKAMPISPDQITQAPPNPVVSNTIPPV